MAVGSLAILYSPLRAQSAGGGARAGGRTTAHAQYDVTIYDIGKRLFDCFGEFIFVRACEGFPMYGGISVSTPSQHMESLPTL